MEDKNLMAEVYPLIEEINLEKIRDLDAPERLARLGSNLFYFAQQDEARDFGISYLNDIHTKEPLMVWSRRSGVGGSHHFTLTEWSINSYVLYDNMQPNGFSEGSVHAYLFGDDHAVSGLVRAMPPRRYKNQEDEMSRYDLEDLINGYQHHPVRNPLFTTTGEVNAFCRIIKSIKPK